MNNQHSIVQFDKVSDMLDGDPAYLKEFCEAAIISFSTYREEYREHMTNRDLENLRKSGHRIKPVAQMMGIKQLIDEYKQAKKIIEEEKDDTAVKASIDRVDVICKKVLDEFREKNDAGDLS